MTKAFHKTKSFSFFLFSCGKITSKVILRVPGGVQHVVWTRFQSFLLLENLSILQCYGSAKIVKATNGDQHEM